MGISVLEGFAKDLQKQAKSINHGIQNIHYEDITESVKNRTLRNIDELAEDILEDGLEHNLVVREVPDNTIYKYELIAGHRRFNAIKKLIGDGYKKFEYIPCKVVEATTRQARKRLLLNNIETDPLTNAEMIEAIAELKEIYEQEKAEGGKVPGRIRELIAKEVGLSSSQVGNYEKIINNAIPEVREKIEDGELTIGAAVELSSLNDEEQLMFIEDHDDLSLKTIKEYKESLREASETLHEVPKISHAANSQEDKDRDVVQIEEYEREDDFKEELMIDMDQIVSKMEFQMGMKAGVEGVVNAMIEAMSDVNEYLIAWSKYSPKSIQQAQLLIEQYRTLADELESIASTLMTEKKV
ncbi:ParB family chromosome partitioning protein [Breznakia sp. PF5-3]|uniref:ParB/RepB/Spo0J family partition protein n=1 Tax=unclassified Breznakia TaxID=2623764 RepID=UPI0024070CC9|nr:MULTISPECIES: ParB/RepB/Spo0J family partition protein [unclassified Breznakia]MDF9825193.1 ParB family chromosome partitioning protein [Breznakia sp. PM6-1]MDF9836051.1 ParB family chromosome partitioning protein [Breznakia sp. PF5-3]MDF9838867.1 ParB family chromosome partitioning protein [Breznakia sp. PFB2-8]MDF9860893.1 ParB family chromosome partitioning protein [Breznakia sp. PH5-24]